ncbi:methyltransferase domain-containing protein [Amylocarpus encephaloides]|uniref:Methyltransferase domain-containing protein n=1 Tax=Amylocarpus encephaloides TaxID=45428 RepID=A0A9P8C3Y7_9HELO|nr:methyltransferase domain-containing protein [Amylocarpus encephaloides]
MRLAKPAQFAVFGGAAVFLILLFAQISSNKPLGDWVPQSAKEFSNSIKGSLARGNIKTMMETSEKLWQKTVDQRHAFRAKFPDMDFFPAVNGPTYFTYLASIWDLVPASYNCPWEVERIGRMGDGGKWVCGMSRYEKSSRPCILYSFGVQNESTFEQEMLERTNCEIWGYDFSVEGWGPQIQPDVRSRTHFMKAAISSDTDINSDPPAYSIQDLMSQNGHDYIDILKIDIEYAEFNALSSLNKHTQGLEIEMPIGQMLIELHLFNYQQITTPIFLDWWESMEYRGMRPAWTEPNLLAVSVHLEDGMPRLAEYTMVNVQDPKNILWK